MAGAKIALSSTLGELKNDGNGNALVNTPTDAAKAGAIVVFTENDDGTHTGARSLRSPETDKDYRLRVGQDSLLAFETFTHAAQNTGKYRYGNTTMTITWSASGLTTNGSSITTTATGAALRTRAEFPVYTAGVTYAEQVLAFTAQPTANVIVEFGLGISPDAAATTPTDGCFFRLTSAGLQCVVSFGGSETTVSAPVSFTYANNQAIKFAVAASARSVDFWADDQRLASISTPTSVGLSNSAQTLPCFLMQRHPGAAGAVLQAKLYSLMVTLGGLTQTLDYDDLSACLWGAYEGTTGNAMGSAASFANSANPTAAVPTNTTAALGTGLGGQFWETDTLAVTTDGVICSYQVPAGSIATPGRRLVVKGVKVESFVQTALTGGGYVAVWSLAFGHTAVSLATTEAATTKAPRRLPLGNQSVASAAAVSTVLNSVYVDLARPIVVNPGEFLAVVKKKVGTAPSAGVIAHTITFDAGWI